jgi:hypothetical protein
VEKAMNRKRVAGAILAAVPFCVTIASPSSPPDFEQKDLFVADRGGYIQYRIPSMVATQHGTLLAVCEAMAERRGDPPNTIDLVMKRSEDNGKTWEPMRVLVDYPGNESASNPCSLVDRETETIWIFFPHGRPPRVSGQPAAFEPPLTRCYVGTVASLPTSGITATGRREALDNHRSLTR